MNSVIEAEAPRDFATTVRPELQTFKMLDAEFGKMVAEYMPLTIAGLNDSAGFKRVHDARIVVKKRRVDVEKTRKLLKEDAIEYGRTVDAEAKRLTAILEPIETHLQRQEEVIEAEKARIKKAADDAKRALVDSRIEALKVLGVAAWPADVAFWTEEQFQVMLAAAHEEAERKALAEAERIRVESEENAKRMAAQRAQEEQLAASRAELERLQAEQRAETERLAAERRKEDERIAAERKAEADRIAAERQKIAVEQAAETAKINAERARIAAEQKAESDRLAAERKRLEDAERERQRVIELENARKEAAERATREEAQRQERLAEQSRREVERQRLESEAKAKAEKEAEELAERERPARDKILQFATSVSTLKAPEVPCSKKIVQILHRASEAIRKLADKPLES